MHDAFRLRIPSTVIGASLLLQLFCLGLSPVRAASPVGHLILKQIAWAGSVGNPADQWVEIYNPTQQVVDLVQDPYVLRVGDNAVATLNSGSVTPLQGVIVSRLDPADPASHSSLSSSLKTLVDPQLVLPSGNAQYVLSNTHNNVSDLANSKLAAPFAGNQNASEQRLIDANGQYLPGDMSAAWTTTQTIGRNVAPDTQQYATPAESNAVSVAQPTNVTIDMSQPDRPTVKANFSTTAPYGIVRFVNGSTGTVIQGVGDTVSGFQPAIPLTAGQYAVSVAAAIAPNGDRSAALSIPLGTVQAVQPTTGTNVQPPVLDPFQAQTNAKTVTLTGNAQAGSVTVVATANGTVVSQPLNSMLNFSLTVPVLQNGGTAIQVVAVAADGSKSQPVTAQIMQSTVAPQMPAADHLKVMSETSGTMDSIIGQAGAVLPGSRIRVYADSALTQLIGQATALSDGSFPGVSLGGNRYATAYVVQTDLAGNMSAPQTVSNPINVTDQNLNLPIVVQNVTANGATFQLLPMTGVVQYLVKYRIAGGQYGSPVTVCAVASSDCSLSKHLMDLQPGTNYDVAIAAVNAQGQMSNYTESSFQTAAMPTVQVRTVSAPVAPPVVAPKTTTLPTPAYAPPAAAVTTPQAAASPTPTAMDMASPSPSATESGAVKSATTVRNWTPWIVLGVLIGLAILATAGYFYWFGGEAGDAMDSAATPIKPTPKEDASINKTDTDRPTKRW